jgi:hypothetical protein
LKPRVRERRTDDLLVAAGKPPVLPSDRAKLIFEFWVLLFDGHDVGIDVVTALLAATSERARGETFLISDRTR